jgi:hypothetical protein
LNLLSFRAPEAAEDVRRAGQIRARTYFLGQKEGCPEGRDEGLWTRARQMEDAERGSDGDDDGD